MIRKTFLSIFLAGLAASAIAQTASNIMQTIPPSLLPQILALNGDLPTKQYPKYISPAATAASSDGKYIYVAEQQMKQVAQFDCATNTVIKTFQVPNEPTGIAVAKDGSKIYVTCASDRWPAGTVCIIDITSGKIVKRFSAGHYSRSPVLSKDEGTLYTCNWLGNDLSVIDLATGTEKRIKMVREPYAAAITPDGATLVVTNSLPELKAIDTVQLTGKVSLISTATGTVRAVVPVTPVGTHSLFGCYISKDGDYAFVTHLVGRFTLPAIKLENGWVHSNNLAVIDIKNGKLANDVELDNAIVGYANPWGIAQTGDGKYLCVVHAGSRSMTIIDYPKLIIKATGKADLSHALDSLYSIKYVKQLQIKSPQSITMIGNKAYITGMYSDSMQIITVSSLTSAEGPKVALGESKPLNTERQGGFNFFDGYNCFQQWQSCFSCHPFTRPDALNWMLGSETTPRQRNVKSMLHAWWTPPTGWSKKRDHAGGPNGSIRMGIKWELQIDPNDDIAIPLDTFIMRLKPVMSPFLIKGRLSASAVRGRDLFSSIGCADCHPAPLYTDNDFHYAGVPDTLESAVKWNTPSLTEAWRTAPYSHTGGYDKIEEIIALRAHSLGKYENLSEQDRKDLVEFVSSL
jgi:DNA-binding beta-propeller fold protein YncE